MRRRRAPIILVAIASFVALVASLPAQTVGWVDKPGAVVAGAQALLGGQDLDGDGRDDVLLAYSWVVSIRAQGWADVRLSASLINPGYYQTMWDYDVQVEFASPGAWITFTVADAVGSTTVSVSQCTGLILPLAGHQRVHAVRADAAGEANFTYSMPSTLYLTTRMIAIDLATCEYSNVVVL